MQSPSDSGHLSVDHTCVDAQSVYRLGQKHAAETSGHTHDAMDLAVR